MELALLSGAPRKRRRPRAVVTRRERVGDLRIVGEDGGHARLKGTHIRTFPDVLVAKHRPGDGHGLTGINFQVDVVKNGELEERDISKLQGFMDRGGDVVRLPVGRSRGIHIQALEHAAQAGKLRIQRLNGGALRVKHHVHNVGGAVGAAKGILDRPGRLVNRRRQAGIDRGVGNGGFHKVAVNAADHRFHGGLGGVLAHVILVIAHGDDRVAVNPVKHAREHHQNDAQNDHRGDQREAPGGAVVRE